MEIVYFSGTGGVQRVAQAFGTALTERGVPVAYIPLDVSMKGNGSDGESRQVAESSPVLLLFAVHAFDAPAPVYAWIEGAPLQGKTVAVISVSGGGEVWPNTGCRRGCIEAIEAKGGQVLYEKMMCMPCNWLLPISDQLAMHLINALPQKVNGILDDVFKGTARRTTYKKGAVRSHISRWEKDGARKFGQTLRVTPSCTGCGHCARHCPVGNITMVEKLPVFQERCIACFRCVYACPTHALLSKNIMVLKKGFSISAVEKRMAGVTLAPVAQCCRGWAFKGIREYLLEGD